MTAPARTGNIRQILAHTARAIAAGKAIRLSIHDLRTHLAVAVRTHHPDAETYDVYDLVDYIQDMLTATLNPRRDPRTVITWLSEATTGDIRAALANTATQAD